MVAVLRRLQLYRRRSAGTNACSNAAAADCVLVQQCTGTVPPWLER
tara:strand:- start:41 stop:178 length:138 start_codon:yes stop_codon:yes gene_type:complete